MSNIIPPLLSSSPPPMVGMLDEDEDDEFGDFAVATNLSYGCDALSLPSSPQKSSKKSENQSSPVHRCNTNSEITDISASKCVEKDFQDKRKNSVANSERIAPVSESTGQENHSDPNVNNLVYNNGKIKPKTDNKYNTFQYFPEIPPDIVPDDEDEIRDVDNGFAEEFDEFQDFESSTNGANGSVLTKELSIPDETHALNVNANPKPSLELTEEVLCEQQLHKENPEPKDKCTKYDDSSKMNEKRTEVEEDNLEMAKSHSTGPINGETCDSITKCKKSSEKPENSTILTNTDLEELTYHETVVAAPQMFDETNLSNENIPSESDTNHSFRNGTISESEDIKIEDDASASKINKFASDAPPSDAASSENEDEFCDFEDHPFKADEQDATDPPQSLNPGQVPVLPSLNQPQEFDEINSLEDDFGDFKTSVAEPKLQWDSDPFSNTKSTDLDTDNFGDFDSQVFAEPPQLDEDQDFGNFGEDPVNSASHPLDQDDFGDFNDFSIQAETSQSGSGEVMEDAGQLQRILSVDVETIPERAQAIILDMFPVIKQALEDYCEEDFTNGDAIFGELGDVTDTCALLYQWSKSNSQHCFLRALNIDTRNILYGPRWNESMPRYAATLGYTPLEPVKSDTLAPTPSEPSTAAALTSSQIPSGESAPQTDIPSAQFDWVGSGLTNPLEMTPKKIVEKRDPLCTEPKNYKQSILPADILRKTSQETDTKPVDFECSSVLQPEISTVLKAHSDGGSVKSLQLNEIQSEETPNKAESSTSEFEDFTSFQSSSKSEESSTFSNWSFNAVPLRETHIATLQSEPAFAKPDRTGTNSDEPGWLKPTILTPDLPRKASVCEEHREEEAEFAAFQKSEPVVADSESRPAKSENTESEIIADHCVNANSLSNDEDDDEFTDFQSTLPTSLNPSIAPTLVPREPLQPAILEPLKSSVLQPIMPTAINWPDPGIADVDLMCIELNYKPKPLSSEADAPLEADPAERGESSGTSQANQKPSKAVDDDDWSDFVSSQGPPAPVAIHSAQPAFKTSQFKQPSRTSTPELSLSVPQLNQIQLPRRPVPLITQKGLLQTKLPVEPLVQPSVQQTKTYPQISQLQNGFQPSLISNQFAAQFGQGIGYQNIHQNRPPQTIDLPRQNKVISNLQQDLYNSSNSSQYFWSSETSKPPTPLVPSSKPDEFEEEWTDFVSSPPTPPVVQNGLQGHPQPKINYDWNRPPQFTSWSANVTPNIITNPVSFDSFQSYSSPAQTDLLKNRTSNRKNPSAAAPPKKNTIPSISSVPDLEFIAPKSRTWKK